ncbi:MAG: TIGR03000 domain-containing protein [Zavarzinella sp.]
MISRLTTFALLLACSISYGQDQKKPATIKLLIPKSPTTTTVKIEGKELPENEKAENEGVRMIQTPPLDSGKTYAYVVEVTIEPNNYTKIIRKREISFKAGEEVTLDVRNKDPKNPDNVLIRWVPTPKVVVEDMCKLAKVTDKDVVLDPGCGDCIMVMTAVKEFKAKKGYGIDIDPEKVKESKKAVADAKLDKVIEVREGNALKLTEKDLADVTVVMLYMGNDLNILVRPLLWKHLKPGARVVSHRFTMGDWAPDKSITVTREGDYGIEDFRLHVWTITGKEKDGVYKKGMDEE